LLTESRRYKRFSRYGGNAISQACPEGFKVAAPPLDLTSDRLETCPGDPHISFKSQWKYIIPKVWKVPGMAKYSYKFQTLTSE
jgi:hypothetical protein